ncbi:hypothetical protein ON010_g5489 [Phytophthora cinnamomi]|nr:hypothetical protein ON010_g5489 [Phytophthora cinnamomi]
MNPVGVATVKEGLPDDIELDRLCASGWSHVGFTPRKLAPTRREKNGCADGVIGLMPMPASADDTRISSGEGDAPEREKSLAAAMQEAPTGCRLRC